MKDYAYRTPRRVRRTRLAWMGACGLIVAQYLAVIGVSYGFLWFFLYQATL